MNTFGGSNQTLLARMTVRFFGKELAMADKQNASRQNAVENILPWLGAAIAVVVLAILIVSLLVASNVIWIRWPGDGLD